MPGGKLVKSKATHGGLRRVNLGYSIPEIMLGLVIMSSLTALTYKLALSDEADIYSKYRAAGVELSKINESVARFAKDNVAILADEITTGELCDAIYGFDPSGSRDALIKLEVPRLFSASEPLGTATAGNHPSCTAIAPVGASLLADNVAEYPFALLERAGYIPAGFDTAALPGGDYRLILHREGARGNRKITAVVVGSEPIQTTDTSEEPDWARAGAIMEAGGGAIGIIREATTNDIAAGFNGVLGELAIFGPTSTAATGRGLGWWLRLQSLALPPAMIATLRPGTLAMKSEILANDQGERIALSGSGAMKTDLNLGGNRIEDAREVQIVGVRSHNQICQPEEEGKLARFANTTPDSVTGLLECKDGKWGNVAGYASTRVFDITTTQPAQTDLVDNNPVGYFESIGAGSVITVPPGITKIHAKVIGGGAGGGCGGASYAHPQTPWMLNYKPAKFKNVVKATGSDDNFNSSSYSCAPTRFVPRTCSSTDALGNTTSWDCSYTIDSTCSSFNTSRTPVEHSVVELEQGEGQRAGGGGGGGGGYVEAILNVLPGDQIRLTIGEGGQGCNKFPNDSPYLEDGMAHLAMVQGTDAVIDGDWNSNTLAFKRGNRTGPVIDDEWSKWGKPSALTVYRNGQFQYGLFGGGGIRGYWGQMVQHTGTAWWVPQTGWGGPAGSFGIAANVGGSIQKAIGSEVKTATFWDSTQHATLVSIGGIGNGEHGKICDMHYIESSFVQYWPTNSCAGGQGGGDKGPEWGTELDPAAMPFDAVYGSGGGGGSGGWIHIAYDPANPATIRGGLGGDGTRGAVILRW